jgi:hypothetical protein
MTVTGTEQRVYGTLTSNMVTVIIPINIFFHKAPSEGGSFHVFNDLSLDLSTALGNYTQILIASQYIASGKTKIDSRGFIHTYGETLLYSCDANDGFWIKNMDTNVNGTYAHGYGSPQIFQGIPDISAYIANSPDKSNIKLHFEVSDFYGYDLEDGFGCNLNYMVICYPKSKFTPIGDIVTAFYNYKRDASYPNDSGWWGPQV